MSESAPLPIAREDMRAGKSYTVMFVANGLSGRFIGLFKGWTRDDVDLYKKGIAVFEEGELMLSGTEWIAYEIPVAPA